MWHGIWLICYVKADKCDFRKIQILREHMKSTHWKQCQNEWKLTFRLQHFATGLQIDSTNCTVCFVAGADGLCSWPRQYIRLWKRKFYLLNFATLFTTKLHQIQTPFCCFCCWSMFLVTTIRNLGNKNFTCWNLLIYLQLNFIRYKPGFVVGAAGLCSWPRQSRKLGRLKFHLLNVVIIFTTKLHQIQTSFCCFCCWVMFLVTMRN